MGCDEDRRNTGRVPGALGAHVGKARAAVGSLSHAWCRAGRCHAGLAIGTQLEPDWAKAEAEGGRAGEAAAKDDQVAASVFAGVAPRAMQSDYIEAGACGHVARRAKSLYGGYFRIF